MDTIGLDGAITTVSASRIASSTPGAGAAAPRPSTSSDVMSSRAPPFTRYSWNVRTPCAVVMRVRTGSSHIGSMRAATPRRTASSAATSCSAAPAARRTVR